jgi:hypothetical protein
VDVNAATDQDVFKLAVSDQISDLPLRKADASRKLFGRLKTIIIGFIDHFTPDTHSILKLASWSAFSRIRAGISSRGIAAVI